MALLALFLFAASFPQQSYGDISDSQEYQIKAGFLYKFLFFVEWPEEVTSKLEDPIIIGILGQDPFGDAFEPVEGSIIQKRKLVIQHFEKDTPVNVLKHCHILFISSSAEKDMKKIIQSMKQSPVLIVSEVEGFLEFGGMLNFIVTEDRVRFEINRRAAEAVGITFRSKLLRLAERIVETVHVN